MANVSSFIYDEFNKYFPFYTNVTSLLWKFEFFSNEMDEILYEARH